MDTAPLEHPSKEGAKHKTDNTKMTKYKIKDSKAKYGCISELLCV